MDEPPVMLRLRHAITSNYMVSLNAVECDAILHELARLRATQEHPGYVATHNLVRQAYSDERATIVAWMRVNGTGHLADCIERGDHHESAQPPPATRRVILSELLPCPFCGGDAMLVSTRAAPEAWVRCVDCDASAKMFSQDEDAVAAWNRREWDRCDP